MKILSLRAVTMIAAAIGWTFPQALAAQSPTPRDTAHITPSGNYLAARQANLERDADAASVYYRAALRTDQRNPELLELAFYSVLADGDIDEAVRLADRLIQLDRNNRNAHLVLGVKALKTKNYKEARQQFGLAARGPVTDLTATLLAGLERTGANDSKGAIDTIDKLSGPEWYGIFKDMHAGLILDLANNKKEAGKRLEHAYKLDSSALRVMQAYAGFLSRNGGREEAVQIYGEFDKQLPHYPLVVEAMDTLAQGRAAAAPRRFGRRPARRKPLRPRRRAGSPRGRAEPRQSRARLSAARPVPRPEPCARDARPRRPL